MVEDKGLPGPVADKIGEMVVLRYWRYLTTYAVISSTHMAYAQ